MGENEAAPIFIQGDGNEDDSLKMASPLQRLSDLARGKGKKNQRLWIAHWTR